MLAPEDRRLYSECLQVPPGLTLSGGIATTYGLDLETLLLVPLGLGAQEFDAGAEAAEDPIVLIESLRRQAGKVTIFHQQGAVRLPRRHHLLFGLLEDLAVPVRPPVRPPRGDGVFHPKLWLLRFLDAEGEVHLRLVVLSRNLTFDRSWDLVLTFEGRPRSQRPRPANAELARLVAELPGLALKPLTADRLAFLDQVVDELRRTTFTVPPGFEGEPRFHALGLDPDPRPWRPEARPGRQLVISPFLKAEPLRHLVEELRDDRWGESRLISRPEALQELGAAAGIEDRWLTSCLNPLLEPAELVEELADRRPSDQDGHSLPSGLHAKILAIEAGWETTWWLGSANVTNAAWEGRNVEILVELRGKKSKVGIDVFLEAGMAGLLVPFRHQPTAVDAEALAAEKAIEVLRRRIANATWTLVVTPLPAAEPEGASSWELRLQGDLRLAEGEAVSVWPVSLPEAQARPFVPGSATIFRLGSAASLTTWIAFGIILKRPAGPARGGLVLNLLASGLPEDRRAEVLRAVVANRDGLMRYLRLLLQGLGTGLGDFASGGEGPSRRGEIAPVAEVLLENLLRALARAPERLRAVSRLLAELEATEEGRRLLPDDLRRLWSKLTELRPELTLAEEDET